ncbi:MAG: VOC family protein [Lysobacterales bacterium]
MLVASSASESRIRVFECDLESERGEVGQQGVSADRFRLASIRPLVDGRRLISGTGFRIPEESMQRVTGIGGIFFKSRDPKALCAWYRDHLGLDATDWGGAVFQWGGPDSAPGTTIWSVFPSDTSRMEPGDASFMLNFRVADLDALLAALRAEGCNVLDDIEASEFGKFGWVMDPDGNKVELWQPPSGQ